jgi:hypothetical protein
MNLRIKKKLIDEKFVSVMSEYVFLKVFFYYYNGENENYGEEMRWCRCYEGQRVET